MMDGGADNFISTPAYALISKLFGGCVHGAYDHIIVIVDSGQA
jgi:hypothetical protein